MNKERYQSKALRVPFFIQFIRLNIPYNVMLIVQNCKKIHIKPLIRLKKLIIIQV